MSNNTGFHYGLFSISFLRYLEIVKLITILGSKYHLASPVPYITLFDSVCWCEEQILAFIEHLLNDADCTSYIIYITSSNPNSIHNNFYYEVMWEALRQITCLKVFLRLNKVIHLSAQQSTRYTVGSWENVCSSTFLSRRTWVIRLPPCHTLKAKARVQLKSMGLYPVRPGSTQAHHHTGS